MKTLLEFAAALQWSILIASALTPRIFELADKFATLHPFLRKLFWVYGAFIVMVVIAFPLSPFCIPMRWPHANLWRAHSASSSRFSGAHDCLCNSPFLIRDLSDEPVLPARLSRAHCCLRIPGFRLRKVGDIEPTHRFWLGGSGFIGQSLSPFLISKNYEVHRAHSRGIGSARRCP